MSCTDPRCQEEIDALRQRIAALEKELEVARADAYMDLLTSLPNRRAGMDELIRTMAHASRVGEQLSISLIDVDHFKAINDTYGHDVGDEVLKKFAHILKDVCRESDFVARYGGEEFLLILPDTYGIDAERLVDRFRKRIETDLIVVVNESHIRATASFGITSLHGHDKPDVLLKRADEALYDAKRGGRNLVVRR